MGSRIDELNALTKSMGGNWADAQLRQGTPEEVLAERAAIMREAMEGAPQANEELYRWYNPSTWGYAPSAPVAPAPVPAPEDVRGKSIWDRASDALGALNPISDANAQSRQVALGSAAMSLPNPHLAKAGFGTQLAGIEGALGGTQGSAAVAPTQQENLRFDLGRAQDTSPRQVYNKGFFGGGSWGTETPEQIATRQQEGQRAFTQKTGFNVPQQDSYLGQQFAQQTQDDANAGYQSQDRDYWGGGYGSSDMDRTVTTQSGYQANAPTAQGDASIQAALDGSDWGGGTYNDQDDDDGWFEPQQSFGGGGFSGPDAVRNQQAAADPGTNTYASPHEQGQQQESSSDDSGGGGK